MQAGRAMLDAIIDLRTPRILLILRNAFGGAYAAFNSYATGADLVLALPTTRVAVMGTGRQGVRLQGRASAQVARRGREAARKAGDAPRTREVAEWLKAQEAELNQRYERELMNPREALSPRLDLRDRHADRPARACSAATCAFLLRHYEPGPMAGAAAGVPLMPSPSDCADDHDRRSPIRTRNNPLIHRDRRLGRVAVAVGALVRLRRHERPDRLPRPDPQGGDRRLPRDGHDAASASCSRRRTASSSRARCRPSCASWTRSTSTRCPTTPAPPRRSAIERIAADHRDLPRRTATTTSSPATASWPRTRDFVRALEEAGLDFIGPCSHTQTAAGAKDEAKRTAIENQVSVTPGVNDATVRTLLRKYPDRAALRAAARRSTGSTSRRSPTTTLPLADAGRAGARGVVPRSASISSSIDELAETIRLEADAAAAEQPGPALPPEGDRRRRRQGPAHLRRRRGTCPALVREVLTEVKATGVGDNKNMLHRAQHRADAPQRDPDPRQRRVVRRARRPRLLAADARAEAGRGLGHAGGPARRHRARRAPPGDDAQGDGARDATSRVLERMEEEAERFGARREARLRLDLRVHRRRRPPLLHGGEHPHPGGAPRLRALLRAALHQPRRSRATPSTSTRWSRRWR